MAAASVARVLIDSALPQLDRLFDYRIPSHLAETAIPGVRVKVPLRSAGRVAEGYLVEVTDGGAFEGTLSELEEVVSPIPVLTPEVYALARRAADRAAGSASDILRLAIPKRQVRVEKQHLAPAVETAPVGGSSATVGGSPATVTGSPATVGGSSAASAVVATTAETPFPPPFPITGYPDLDAKVIAHERIALDAIGTVVAVRGPDETAVTVGHWALTIAQLAASALARGESSILAVPDFRDQWQLEAALAALLPPNLIVTLDARQSNPDRYRGFLRCLGEHPLVVVGNRSVVYAPAPNLGLVVVFDDGDPLHAEPLAPYVHARDAALVRQELEHCALVVVGHSRSTEIERLVEIGWFEAVAPTRIPQPRVIPTAQQLSQERYAAQARIPSTAWREARTALESGPVLVQVARPGYAPRLACVDCGQSARCRKCEGPLAKKSANSPPACSWCGALAVGWSCRHCEGTMLRVVGQTAGRTAEDLGRAFPGVRVIIADGERTVLTVGPEPALVIATRGAEPIATGGYRAVLLLDGESMAARESLRVAEDCLRWWSNAAALAAPRAPVMLVGVGGALATAMATWRQPDYARSELADRRELRFPPAVRVATLTGPLEAVTDAAAAARAEPVDVLGPVDLGDGKVRTIVRFDYARGIEVAAALRAEVIRVATARRAALGKRAAGSPRPVLRVRLDDVEPFLDV